jgi:formylglycine-generating enzyme required for sulfatase activity
MSGTISTLFGNLSLAGQTGAFDDNAMTGQPVSARPMSLMIAGILPKDGEDMYEIEFWNSIKDSTHAEDYEAYLKAYPNGRFAPLAKVRIERYRESAQPTQPAQPAAQAAEEKIQVESINERYRVVTNTNVRSGPSSDTDKIGELAEGSSVQVTGQVVDKNWYQIDNPTGGVGYVYAPLLTKPAPAEPPAQQPKTVSTPPPPPPAPTVTPSRVSAGGAGADCDVCPEMVTISPDAFTMGDSKGDISEMPAHHVTLSKPYAIGKYEVTVGQWKACVAAGDCKKIPDSDMTSNDLPARDISWGDAMKYVGWISRVTGKPYRLPTEAEWEYAARAGTQTRYWWGNEMVPGKAYCKDCGGQWDFALPVKVGSLEPNPFGLYDMNGNVWEWVADCWHRNYNGAPSDGRVWDDPSCTVRVIRSGSWRNDKTYVHSASRFKYDAYVRYLQNGFRVAKTLE